MPNCFTTLMSCVMQGTVGDHIQTEAKGEMQQKLWSFVSSFSENNMDGDKLSHLYFKLKGNKAAPSGQSTTLMSPACFAVAFLGCARPSCCRFRVHRTALSNDISNTTLQPICSHDCCCTF